MSNTDLKCPFRATLITQNFGCPNATEITRRDGPDIACVNPQAHLLCDEFYRELKTQALTTMGYTDDLTQMPASVLQKIQYGGLLGLYNQVLDKPAETIESIVDLVSHATLKYGTISKFPYPNCIESIQAYKMKRRRDR